MNFIHSDQSDITITSNKVTFSLNLQIIKKYVKNTSSINTEVNIPQLLQSKLYLKIIGIPYLVENTNTPITTDIVKAIIKNNYTFNNITIASRLCIIKVSPKSDIVII